jgi:hypothetical protein
MIKKTFSKMEVVRRPPPLLLPEPSHIFLLEGPMAPRASVTPPYQKNQFVENAFKNAITEIKK